MTVVFSLQLYKIIYLHNLKIAQNKVVIFIFKTSGNEGLLNIMPDLQTMDNPDNYFCE